MIKPIGAARLMPRLVLMLTAAAMAVPAVAAAGTEKNFAVMAGNTVANTGPTVVTGDVGVFPGSAITGFPPGVVMGAINATAVQAQLDLTTAYNDARATPCTLSSGGGIDFAGVVLTPGVYCYAGPVSMSSNMTLDFANDPNAVFIIRTTGALTTTAGTSVLMIRNAGVACPPNVTWHVGSSANLGANSSFVGDILALTNVTLGTQAQVAGSARARNGSVTMDTNIVAKCAAAVAPPAPVPTMSEWALILLGMMLAGGAALMVQRRRTA